MSHGKEKDSPRITINKVYTRTGDWGKTRLVGGQLRDKSDIRIRSYGAVDELSAVVGLCRESIAVADIDSPKLTNLNDILKRIQQELFNLGTMIATLPEDFHKKMPRIETIHIRRLETELDDYNDDLPPLKSFVLPGGSEAGARFHLARTVCRRAERECVELSAAETLDNSVIQYLNRLSDAFFVWSRWVTRHTGGEEILWTP